MNYAIIEDVADCADCGQSFVFTAIGTVENDPVEPDLCPDCEKNYEIEKILDELFTE